MMKKTSARPLEWVILKKILLPAAAFLGSWCSLSAQPAVAAGPAREFRIGALQRLDELPASPFRDRLGQLPPAAQGRALQWLKSFHLPAGDVASLHADHEGGICYGCHFSHPEPGDNPTVESMEAPAVGLAAVPVSPFPSQLVFHSRPGAPNVLYINFTGETVTGTQWNTVVGRTSIPALAFSTDSDFSTFSDSEQVVIKRVWQRMAEDYAPFDIDVTTERPATFTPRTAMALITRKTDANGALNPYDTAGGVAYINVFGSSSYATYRPAWIYHDNLSNNESYIAEAASHEIGHNLGLSHDGASSEYYGGHGSGDTSWGPLMGTGYNRNVSQWSKGEYDQATNTQDDLATIAGKISYRTDDHGNTPASATALTISGGTDIVSTTIENDPANANPANKGVLERNTDVDIFSFVTGNGPVRLAVNPWIMPAGTRGGNLDLLIELYNDSGNLLASNNPATQTTALIETTLAEGRYYLHVRNSGAGTPLVSPPSGYTVYGSIGQYHISGFITESGGFVVPPLAELQATDLTQSGQASYQFTVTYSDDVAIDVSTIGNGDVRVTGPNGFNQLAQFVSLNATSNGTPRTATYSVTPPSGGSWSPVHNGTYAIAVEPGQVADTQAAFVAASQLGEFQVVVPLAFYSANMDANPNWTFDGQWQYGPPSYSGNAGGPSSGFTGSQIVAYNLSGNYTNGLSTQYATTPAINTSGSTSLTLRFRRWLKLRNGDTASLQVSANNGSWIDVWSTNRTVSDSSWQLIQYELPASVAGSSSLRLRWGLASGPSQNEIGWNIDDVELLGNGALDAIPPQPNLSVANLTQGGSPSHSCSVTYTDATAVRLASLDSADLLVTGPNGYSSPAEFVGADLPVDGSPITASYAITPPGGVAWSEAHNGTYTITLLEGAVDDTLNNANPQTTLGTFSVAISTATPGTLTIDSSDGLVSSGPVGGPFTPSSVVYTLSNSGGSPLNWAGNKNASWVNLSATGGSLAPGASTQVTVSVNGTASSLGTGDYNDLVSFSNLTSGNGNTNREVALTVIQPGLLAVTSADPLVASGTVGGPFTPNSAVYTLSNSGGTTLNWTAGKTATWLDLSATSGSLAPGASIEVTVSLNEAANTLAAGTFNDSVSFTNTTDGSGNTSREVTLTVNSPGLLAVASADPFSASGTVGGPFTPSSAVYTLSNSGGTALNWTAGKTATWLDLSATSGSLAPGASIEVTVSLNESANTLAAGTFNDSVNFTNTTDGSGTTNRGVTLTVNSPGLLAVASTDPLVASGTVGGPFTPSSVVYTLSNSGDTTLNWTASKTATWFDLSATSGSLAPGASTEVTVSLNESANTLAAGTFNDSVNFTNTTDGNGTTNREITLTVNSPGLLAVASADPLLASGTVGGPFTPNSAVYTLSNSGGTTLNWTAGKTATWLDLSATGGSLAPGASTEVTVSLNESANTLVAGTFNDSVSFTNSTDGNGSTSREVSLTVNSPGLLAVASADPFSASGTVGGPFTPSSAVYTLSNSGGTTLNWTAGKTAAWFDLSATGGSLAPGASIEITVSLNDAANTLAAGNFHDSVSFTNTTDGNGSTSRGVSLTVNVPPELKVAIQSIAENGVFQIVIQGPAATPVVLEATEDLVKWKIIATGSIGPDGTLTLTDPESAILPIRFYRVSRQ
jgi:hypothetical protein